jgi:hypothetical protein
LNRSFVNNGAKRRMQMLIDMERIEAMSDEELIKVSKGDMVRFLSTHSAERLGLLGSDIVENEFRRIMNYPDLMEQLKEWFYRAVRNRHRELKEAKERGEAWERSFETGSVKDLNDCLEADFLCFDLKNLSPRQLEALFRLIDDDPDLDLGWSGGRCDIISVASKSMTSAMPEAWHGRWDLLGRLAM